MSKVRVKDGFAFEMNKAEAEEYFYGDAACEFGTPKPVGLWEALLTAPVLDENDRKEYLASHCYSPLVKELIQNSMKEGDDYNG